MLSLTNSRTAGAGIDKTRRKIRLQWTTKNGDPDRNVAQRLGYDLNRGRLDLTHHPFSTRFSTGDVRITTHVNENDLGDVLFSTLHEAGHAMYEQGISAALDGTPLGKGVSAGVHESQSRLWENVVGRSRGFWEHFYPSLQRVFPEQLGSVPIAVPVNVLQAAVAIIGRRRRADLQSAHHVAFTRSLPSSNCSSRSKRQYEWWSAPLC
jgi:Zn-dependent M32 family carboxypeptidase